MSDIKSPETSVRRGRRRAIEVCALLCVIIIALPISYAAFIANVSQFRAKRSCAMSKSVVVFVTTVGLQGGGYYELTDSDATSFLEIMLAGTAPAELASQVAVRAELSMQLFDENHHLLTSVKLEPDGTTEGMAVWSALRAMAFAGRRLTEVEEQRLGEISNESAPTFVRNWYQ